MADQPDTSKDRLLTFMLEGEVSLESFAEALSAFNKLVAGLSQEAGGDIDWQLEDLTYSSAVTVVKGHSPNPERVARVVRDYVDVGRALQRNQPLRLPTQISRPANAIRRVFRQSPRIKAVRFENDDEEAIMTRAVVPVVLPIYGNLFAPPQQKFGFESLDPLRFTDAQLLGAYGAVEGTVQTLTNRRGHRFTLYDSINDRAVSCYLEKGHEPIMRDAWGKRAIVEGWVTRDPSNGNAIAVREVTEVTIVNEEDGDFTQARSILPLKAGDLTPEETIRRLRDG